MKWKCEQCKATANRCTLEDGSKDVPNDLCPYADKNEIPQTMIAHWFTNCATCGGDGEIQIIIDGFEEERDCKTCKGSGIKYAKDFYA
jgi:DnaJ-class molecular chaperone